MIKKYNKLNENMDQMEREMDKLKTFFDTKYSEKNEFKRRKSKYKNERRFKLKNFFTKLELSKRRISNFSKKYNLKIWKKIIIFGKNF